MNGIVTNFLLVIILIAGLSSCSRESPEEIAVKFAEKPSYELLATSEKAILTIAEFNELVDEQDSPKPTDEFYKLDKYLLERITFNAKKVTKVDGKTVVLVEWKYPTFISELYSYKTWDSKNREFREKAINFTKAIESSEFNPEDISYSTSEREISILEDGVFVDAKAMKAELEIAKKTKPLLEGLNKIADRYNSIFSMIKLNADKNITFEKYITAMSKKMPDMLPDILKATDLLAEIRSLDPTYELRFNQESFFEDAEKVISIHNSAEN
ncbi:hypothetical protein [Rheinheimera soli]|uniref:Uncharacterized protein n=1 Tax=Rheinheimera soli TaxID=443616 RepID=A0ABU1VVJ9_9GAMM|nr:hypothetical protein [Rheinheimera soli]MDR7119732.1 hypothetical protein [Rheinheimera soli]